MIQRDRRERGARRRASSVCGGRTCGSIVRGIDGQSFSVRRPAAGVVRLMDSDEGSRRHLARKLTGMFPDAGLWEEVGRELRRYGNEQHEREAARVHVAILKVAGASRERIREWVDVATRDYRDVLAAAEYPAQLRSRTWMMADPERNAIESDDLRQYDAWIRE